VKVAIGLVYCTDKKAIPTAAHAELVLKRCGITKKDKFWVVNDTTNAALMTGRLLAGENGTCVMHEIDLVMEHSLGMKQRTRNQNVVDHFDDCEAFRKKEKKVLSYLGSV
jgi:hypothetical protein